MENKDIETILQKLINRQRPGPDNIINGLLKYGGEKLNQQLTIETTLKQILFPHKIPDEIAPSFY